MVIAACFYVILDLNVRPFLVPSTQRLSSVATTSLLILSVCVLILSDRFREDPVVAANTDYRPVQVIQILCIFAPPLYLLISLLWTKRRRILERCSAACAITLRGLRSAARSMLACIASCGPALRKCGAAFPHCLWGTRPKTRAVEETFLGREESLQQHLVPA
jgi:hypothetical protein